MPASERERGLVPALEEEQRRREEEPQALLTLPSRWERLREKRSEWIPEGDKDSAHSSWPDPKLSH